MTEDPVYGTPVFTTMGGKSKCPGETGTSRRESGIDMVIMHRCKNGEIGLINNQYVYNKECHNLPNGEIAIFSVIITNLSPTGTLKLYIYIYINIYKCC